MNKDDMTYKEIIDYIDASQLDYEDWLKVGMAIKDCGGTAAEWDTWSQGDSRYVSGECFRKWESSRGNGKPITIATLVKFAKDQGYNPPRKEQTAYDWDDVIGAHIVDQNWIQPEYINDPQQWDQKADIIKYLSTIFQSDEHVGYVTESYHNKKADRFLPKSGAYDRTAGQLIEELQKARELEDVFGDYNHEVGAWIRFNPLDGKGVKDANVIDYRYTLIESDEMPIADQNAIIRELELPVTALVHSGGKSLHAIIRVDADNYDQYRERVDFLYDICKKNGFKLDKQNRNPSRLSRFPGFFRNGNKQFLVDTHIGKENFQEWKEWIEELNDDLPDIEELTITNDEPDLAPELITGILREGHKLLISGPSKAGKSFLLNQLCIAIAEGKRWLNFDVKQGKVLYVNLELDARSCKHRYWKQYQKTGIQQTSGMLHIWNLRGSATSMDKLAPKLIRRAQKNKYTAIVIDPIYKVLTGDENSAEQMALFCNQFDKICNELGSSVIYCHHHSKGAQGQKSSKDRSSGSGVFARDPDAILDLVELKIDDDRREAMRNIFECQVIQKALDSDVPGWRNDCPQDDAIVVQKLVEWCEDAGHSDLVRQHRPDIHQAVNYMTGWRIEVDLREFPSFNPVKLFFQYPVHIVDEWDLLKDAKADGEEAPWEAKRKEKTTANKQRKKDHKEALVNAISNCSIDGDITVDNVAEYLGCTPVTVRNRIKTMPQYEIKKGIILTQEKR